MERFGNFLSGPGVENPPSNARDTGSIPGKGTKIPHATGQLSLCTTTRVCITTTTEPSGSRAHTQQQKKPVQHSEDLAQTEF